MPGQVERIESWTHARRLEHTNRPDPQSTFDAKFSVQYCLARALADRKVVIGQFEDDGYRDPAIRRLLARVHVAPYTTAQFPAENHFGAEVRVTLRDGTVHAAKVDQPFGRTSANPLPPALLKEKFVNCALRALPEAYQETMILRLVEGMTGPEIAEQTGLSPGSVRVNLHRGMKLLRDALGIAQEGVSDDKTG